MTRQGVLKREKVAKAVIPSPVYLFIKEVPKMGKKILLWLTLVAILVVMVFMVIPSSAPMLAVIPLAAATVACPIVKYTMRMKSPTPKLLCGIPARCCTLLVNITCNTRALSRMVNAVTKIPFTMICKLESFRYEFATGSRFLTTQLNY